MSGGDPGPGGDQKRRIRSMFDAVAPRYDLLNRLLSAGFDVRWRRRAVRALRLEPGHRVLDLCAGTGDLGLEARRQVPGVCVVGIDLAREMLLRGSAKSGAGVSAAAGHPVAGNPAGENPVMYFVQGDAERIPLPDASVDAACVGFGIRNVASLERAFAESARVLRPGGRFAVLEFTLPPRPVVRSVYRAYFHHVLPRVGGWISGRPDAYRYLPASVDAFPPPADLAAMMRAGGFRAVTWSLLSGGIAALHVGTR
jgi:demethylmenaquinone methyltransferase/2-methoxy-6-polyprenyl-1,4-benzoquinol methylase